MNIVIKILRWLGLVKKEKSVQLGKKPSKKAIQTPTVKKPVKQTEPSSKATDPLKSKKGGTVDTFLWKPLSDNNPLPVVVVSCETIKAKDLHMEIIGKSGKALKVDIQNNGSRANQLSGYKYGRIHFRPQRTAKAFNRSAPLKIRFFHTFTGKKVYVKVRKRDSVSVKHVSQRKDLK